jgi:hypothetical protein
MSQMLAAEVDGSEEVASGFVVASAMARNSLSLAKKFSIRCLAL